MPRKVVAIGLSMAVQFATLAAPLVHVHPDEHASTHHGAHEVHAHLGRHASRPESANESTIDHPENNDRAVFVRLFVGVACAGFDLPAAVSVSFDLAPPSERRSLRALYGFHGHDPPFMRSRSSRAPPAILS